MSYQDILVYLDGAPGHAAQMRCALQITKAHRANLHCLYLKPDYELPVVLAAPIDSQLVEDLMASAQHQMEAVKSQCLEMAAETGASIRWMDRNDGGVHTLSRHMWGVDLVVIGQHAYLDPFEPGYVGTSSVLRHAPIPVLMVPDSAGNGEKPFNRIVLAWNGSGEATRAIHDALPLLHYADDISLLSVINGRHSQQATADRLIKHLSNHGLQVRKQTALQNTKDVGEVIRDHFTVRRADLMVMGAYSRSSLREAIFGGVTKDALRNATCPTLMSH